MTQGVGGWYERNGFFPKDIDKEKLKEMIASLKSFSLSQTLSKLANISDKTIDSTIAKYSKRLAKDNISGNRLKLDYWRQLKRRRDLALAATSRFLSSNSNHPNDCNDSQGKGVETATQELLKNTFTPELQTALETRLVGKNTISDLLTFIYKPDRSGCELYAEVAELLFPSPWDFDNEELAFFKDLLPAFESYYNVLTTGIVLEKRL